MNGPSEPRVRVLILEDRSADAELAVAELRRAGFEPDWQRVETRDEYAAHLEPGLDVILADYSLPSFSVTEALRILGERGLDIPLIIVSGAIGEDVAVECMRLGAADYLLKDRLTRLGEAVRRVLQDKRLREERRRVAEEASRALARSEAHYRDLFDQVPVGLYRTTPAGEMIDVNAALVQMLGYPDRQTLLSVSAADLYATPGERREALLPRMARDGMARGLEARWRRFDGTIVWVRNNVRAVHRGDVDGAYWEGAVEDITERRELEDQLRQMQKMEAIGQLAGGIAHDFNNLLTVIMGHSELTLQDVRHEEEAVANLRLIHLTAERASALTRQLLAFSRKQVLQPSVLDLPGVVAGIAPMLRRLIGEHIELVVAGEHKGRVSADRAQLEQVMTNLAINARDAMRQGGRLTMETAHVTLDEPFAARHPGARPGRFVVLAVTDTGTGMDASTKARIFEPFFTTKDVGEGTGLGLSTVYGIVKQHDGYIEVDSTPGRGSTFRIYLPRTEEPPAKVAVAAWPAELRGEETILLVEDEPQIRALVRKVLEMSGYTVLESRHTTDAVEIAQQREGRIDLLISDMVMPRMNGLEVARHVRAAHPETKVLYMSGYTGRDLSQHGTLRLDAPLLEKPFTNKGLLMMVRLLLDRPEV